MSGQPPPPLNRPVAQQVGLGIQPGSTRIVIANYVIIFGPSGSVTGIFVYPAGTTPALGNPPVISITEGTKDPYGNTVTSGDVVYDYSAGILAQLAAGILRFTAITAALGTASAQYASSSVLGVAVALLRLIGQANANTIQTFVDITGGTASSAGAVWIYGQNPQAQGTSDLPGVYVGGPVTRLINGASPAIETWHAASLATGWTGSIRYKLSVENRVFLEVSATFTDNGTTHLVSGADMLSVVLPAAYRPAASTPEMAAGFSGTGATITAGRVPCVHVGTGGAVFADFVTTTANAQTAFFQGEFSYPLD